MTDETIPPASIFVGVGAVVFRDDDVLLIKRGKPPFLGQWSIPGGGLEIGETIIDAVKREVREETQIEIDVAGLIDVFEAIPGRDEGASRHMLMIDYWARWRAGEPVAGDDAADAVFVPLEDAFARLAWDKTRDAVHRAARLRDR